MGSRLGSSDLQLDSDLDSIRNSCDVCLQRSVFFAVLVDFSCHQSTFMAIKIIMQELRDIAFKFSSAMTGVTEKAARLKSWQQTEPHRNGVISVFTAFWTTSP